MRYLIDTSALIEAMSRDLLDRLVLEPDVDSIELVPSVEAELERLSAEGGARGRRARAALAYARQTLKTAREATVSDHVDDVLLATAEADGLGIVTQDHELARRAKQRGIRTLTLKRSGKIGD